MIQVDHLVKRFGSIAAVDDISFEVAQGERLAVIDTAERFWAAGDWPSDPDALIARIKGRAS